MPEKSLVSAADFKVVSGFARIRQICCPLLGDSLLYLSSPSSTLLPHTKILSKMAAMQKAVVTIGQDKIIRSVNREAIRLFGYQRADELIGYALPPMKHLLLSPPLRARHLE